MIPDRRKTFRINKKVFSVNPQKQKVVKDVTVTLEQDTDVMKLVEEKDFEGFP